MSLPSEFAWLRSSLVEPRILSQTSLFEGCGSGEAASRLLARSNIADKNPRTYPPCVFQAYWPSSCRVTAADGDSLARLSREGPEVTLNRSAFRELTGVRSFVMAPRSIRVFGSVRPPRSRDAAELILISKPDGARSLGKPISGLRWRR